MELSCINFGRHSNFKTMGQERLVHACKNKTKQNINTAMLYQTVGF